MTGHRASLAFGMIAATLLVGCQPTVKPDLDDPHEPQTEVALAPRLPPVIAKPAAPEAEPEPEALPPVAMDTGAQVFDRMSARFSPPICVKGEHNRRWRKRYAGHPASFARHVEQVLPLMAYVVEEVERRNLPGEFALVPIVESWYRPEAIGPGGPAGMWQMIASTARNHGIVIKPGYDGRLSPVESTDAALDYLETLGGMFDGEWRAMSMAYNAGEYRIIRALRSSGDRRVSGESHLPRGLSRITYDYVAKMHALACLVAQPDRHGLTLPREAKFIPLARVSLPEGIISLDQAAIRLGVDAARLRQLNPAYRQGRVIAGVPREVLAPATALFHLAAAGDPPDTAPSPIAAARTYEIKRGDTLSGVAARHGVTLRSLFRLNGLSGRSVLRPGQVIRIDP